jgi:uncharacterized membrane protein
MMENVSPAMNFFFDRMLSNTSKLEFKSVIHAAIFVVSGGWPVRILCGLSVDESIFLTKA